jgi:hypothetical protein
MEETTRRSVITNPDHNNTKKNKSAKRSPLQPIKESFSTSIDKLNLSPLVDAKEKAPINSLNSVALSKNSQNNLSKFKSNLQKGKNNKEFERAILSEQNNKSEAKLVDQSIKNNNNNASHINMNNNLLPNYISEYTNDDLLHSRQNNITGVIVMEDNNREVSKLKLNESSIEKKGNVETIFDESVMNNIENTLQTRAEGRNKPAVLMLKDDTREFNAKSPEGKNNLSNNLKESQNSSSQVVCRICYEESTADKGKLLYPCHCIGSVQYIHESCLKKWIENNVMNERKMRPECELCKFKFQMKFSSKYKFSREKFWGMMKNLAAMVLVATIILTLVFTVIYVVVTSLTTLDDGNRSKLVNILVSIGTLILAVLTLMSFRNCKLNYYERFIKDWKIYNVNGI